MIEEPLAFMSREELQLRIMQNIEFEVSKLDKRNAFRRWWDYSRNWERVQAIINGNTSKAGSTSSAQQCRFMGVDPDGRSFRRL